MTESNAMQRVFLAITVIILMSIMKVNGAESFSTPDFAYPANVEKNALRMLSTSGTAPAGERGAIRLRALLEMSRAAVEIDPDSIFAMPGRISHYASLESGNPQARAMLELLQAQTLSGIYLSNRWRYDRVDAPLAPLPEDIRLWSGRQFRNAIEALLLRADSLAAVAPAMSLEAFDGCVKQSGITMPYVPTVGAFVRYRAIETLRELDNASLADSLLSAAISSTPSSEAPYYFWIWQKDDNNASALMNSYKAHSDVEAARLLLLKAVEAVEVTTYDESGKEVARTDAKIAAIEESLSRFPSWGGNADLRNILSRLTAATARCRMPDYGYPGKALPLTVDYEFATKVAVTVYRLPEGRRMSSPEDVRRCSVDTVFDIEVSGRRGSSEVKFMPQESGRYAAVCDVDGVAGSNVAEFDVVPFLPVVIGGCDRMAVLTPSFADGTPMPRIGVVAEKHRRGVSTKERLGQTDADGILLVQPEGTYNGNTTLAFEYGGLIFDFGDSYRRFGAPRKPDLSNESATLFTDRALYRPGDSVAWSMAAGERLADGTMRTASHRRYSAKLLDANNTVVDSIEATTDTLGRAYGVFATVRGGLQGSYTLRVSDGNRTVAMTSVMVSDYRMPVFEVVVTAVRRGVPAAGAITINGKATTYSGMPVASARVDVEILGASRWRWFVPERSLGKLECSTGADGTFSVEVPVAMLEQKNGSEPYHSFVARVLATAVNAETATCERNFTTGKPYSLDMSVASVADGSKPLTGCFYAYDSEGVNKPMELVWRIGVPADGGKTLERVLASGSARAGSDCAMDIAAIPAGCYSIEVAAADTALADTRIYEGALTVYNTARNEVPDLDSPLFMPPQRIFTGNGKSRVLIGVAADKATVYIAVRHGNKLHSIEPRTLRRGFHRINVANYAGEGGCEVLLATVANGVSHVETLEFEKPAVAELEITAESFRDRLVPGDTEQWRLRLSRGGRPVEGAAVVATMFNRALSALTPYRMSIPFRFYTPQPSLIYTGVSARTDWCSAAVNPTYEVAAAFEWPQFMFIADRYFRYFTGSMATARKMAVNDMAFSENTMLSESEESVGAVEDADAGASDTNTEADYRDAEVAQAFFVPSLTSDGEGNVDIVFTVPNANAEWQFESVAWTASLASARHSYTARSSKPVMVQPNLPRFLRQGDRATVLATVFNNTDSAAVIRSIVEIFDPASGRVISRNETTSDVEPQASATVSAEIEAPADAASVGYRVRAVLGGYSDGEQSAIPVLAAESTVINSTEFYLDADAAPLHLDVPVEDGMAYTLQYCSNPVWTVVKALRGLAKERAGTSTWLASQLFSSLAAGNIAAANPAIGRAFEQWRKSDSDVLESMLSRNADLKLLLLEQTPWLQASADQTMRMEALAAVFDAARVKADIEAATESLAALQGADGGFAWASWNNSSSVWATGEVLTTLAIARSLDMLQGQPRLSSMVSRAFAYYQQERTGLCNADGVDFDFARIACLYPGFTLTDKGQRLLNRTVEWISREWRSFDAGDKAWSVLILKSAGKRDKAKQILSSLEQFGVERPGQGLCFPSVDDIRSYANIMQAFAAMDAPAATIDAMRQWITVRAQATDNLGACNPDYVIAALLLTGSDWTAVDNNFSIVIDGHVPAVGELDRATGYSCVPVDASGDTIRIEVRPNGNTPSYGSVVAVGRRPMDNVEAREARDLSIAKRFLVNRGGSWVETDSFALGERVRVQLTVIAGRDMQYVVIDDERPAALEPADQLPGYVTDGALGVYRVNADSRTQLFADRMPKGTWHLTYDMTANNAGTFTGGAATIQSQYAPELTARSAGERITVGL